MRDQILDRRCRLPIDYSSQLINEHTDTLFAHSYVVIGPNRNRASQRSPDGNREERARSSHLMTLDSVRFLRKSLYLLISPRQTWSGPIS